MSYFTAEKIGEALAKARVAAGLSQHDMARYIGKGRSTIQNWESGVSSPDCDEIMDWFTACRTSPLAPMQEMLHPELYNTPLTEMTDEAIEAALTDYFHTAPRIIKEMMLFLVLGKHGSYPPAVIAEMCANLHTPLQNRVSTCGQILDNYNCAVAAGTDPSPKDVQPPVNLLRTAYKAGKDAVMRGLWAYTARKGEHP